MTLPQAKEWFKNMTFMQGMLIFLILFIITMPQLVFKISSDAYNSPNQDNQDVIDKEYINDTYYLITDRNRYECSETQYNDTVIGKTQIDTSHDRITDIDTKEYVDTGMCVISISLIFIIILYLWRY